MTETKNKPLTPPTHCCFCGKPLEVVRKVIATFYEVDCAECERTALISVDDAVAMAVALTS